MMRKTLIAALLGMAGCAGMDYPQPNAAYSAAYENHPGNDRGCIIAASDKLARRGLTAVDSRVVPMPDGLSGRMVELDVQNAGLTQTYVYACVSAPHGNFARLAGVR
jgi:hypothetical protein